MQFVRSSSAGRPLDPGAGGGRQAAVLVQLESVTLVVVTTAPGDAVQAPHHCAVDRLLFVLEGTVPIELEGRQVQAEAGSLLHIPAGMVAGLGAATSPARHLELFVPSAPVGGPLWRELGAVPAPAVPPPPPSPSPPSSSSSTATAALVTRLDLARFGAGSRGGGFAVQTLADHTHGVHGAVVNAAQVAAGGAGPPLHIHRFDQLFVVIEGELQVSVAGQQVLARRHDVVVLPAGVAHTQWNAGEQTEVHLAVLVPPPAPGTALTEPVEFRLLA